VVNVRVVVKLVGWRSMRPVVNKVEWRAFAVLYAKMDKYVPFHQLHGLEILLQGRQRECSAKHPAFE